MERRPFSIIKSNYVQKFMSVKNNINVNMSVSGLLKSALDSQMFVSLSKKLALKLRKGEISVSNCYTNNAS